MKKKMIISAIVVLLLIASVGGGFYMFQQKKKEAQVVEWEKVVAKQIKNTFVDIEEIRFSEVTSENWLANITGVSVNIITDKDNKNLSIVLPPDFEDTSLQTYGGKAPEKGLTENKIKVVYSDSSEEEI
ncbi:hypothetical protein [Enterococcus sp. BWR-S5]|uniref:hypothetical protein n=1 Tax=Enterococcus sp. BWR-S5 TaxID=2787714 RepID=UPI001922E626|nr:hypothetical protein [Enterococcus sp. BWR-S5]MBL1224018.1 hypothetical protein [Enterococcus sp. BWR-S5]